MRNKNNELLEKLADYIRSQPNYNETNGAFVSIYRHSRHFGGPEEGGWWYSRMTLEGYKHFPSQELAEKFLEEAKKTVEKQNRAESPMRARACAGLPDEDETPCPAGYGEGYIPNDWSDGGELEVLIESELGASDNSNEPTPRYE